MNTGQKPQANILIKEVHYYDIELAEIPTTNWRKAEGSIQVRIPYDGAVFTEDASQQETFHVGDLQVSRSNDTESEPETLPVDIEAGEKWWEYIKSGKRAVYQSEYNVPKPEKTLFSIQGEVLDFASSRGTIFNSVVAFQNPLRLQLDLWLPDIASYSPKGEVEELEEMLLRREHTQQVFMQYNGDFEQQLARNLVALANSYGGTLFVGVDEQGKVIGLSDSHINEMPKLLLEAVLRATPAVCLQRAKQYWMPNGRCVYVITVSPKKPEITHSLDNQIYQRQKRETILVSSSIAVSEAEEPISTETSLYDLVEIDETGKLHPRDKVDVAVLDDVIDLKSLEIGRYICAMINRDLLEANIVIHGLSQPKQENVESYLQDELREIVPRVPSGIVELTQHNNQVIVLITIPIRHIPVALYKEKGFVWEKGRVQPFSQTRLLEKYIANYADQDQQGISDVRLESASIEWPIRPAENLNVSGRQSLDIPTYDAQRHVLTWEPVSFINKEDNAVGCRKILSLPLTNVSLTANEKGEVSNQSPIISGQIEVRLDGIVVSGLNIDIKSDAVEDAEVEEDSYLYTLPIIKRTYLNLNITVRLGEIFKHRRPQQSFLRFFLSNTLLDIDRARDVILSCADAGFRLYSTQADNIIPEVEVLELGDLGNDRTFIKEARIFGIRNNRYHDIHLGLGLRCLPSPLTRALRYGDVHDTTQANSFALEVIIVLEGMGEEVGQEISRLQMRLFELLRQRLQQLGTE